MVGEYRSHKLPQAWERQKMLSLLFCFPSRFCWDDFVAPFPCLLLSGQEQEQEVALPCVLCMCDFMYGLPQPSLFGCLHPKKALPSLGCACLSPPSLNGPSHVFDTFLFCLCQRLMAKGRCFASPFHSLSGCLLTSIKVQC